MTETDWKWLIKVLQGHGFKVCHKNGIIWKGKIEFDPQTLRAMKRIDLNTRLGFPHEMFVAIEEA